MILKAIALINLIIINVLEAKDSNTLKYCKDFDPTHDFDEDSLLGMWFIHEYIFHTENKVSTEVNVYCPTIQIRTLEDYLNGALVNGEPINLGNLSFLNVSL